ncbi:coiled-coil domain-containing protein 178 [Discoglossus pictus]
MNFFNYIHITDSQQPFRTALLKKNTEAVISEAVELIWRLEADRQEAEEALKLEKKRKQALIMKIDTLSLWKLHHLPEAVQKEHETCARDISELQWHIACKRQELENAQNKAAKTEAVNARLQEEINFIKKHSPLLEDKLNLEGDAMSRIRQAQTEATKLLREAEEQYKSAKQSFDQATAEANQERKTMMTELDELTKKLQSSNHELCSSENTWTEYNLNLSSTEKQIADGKITYANLLTEKQMAIESEKSWNHQVDDLKYELDDQSLRNKNLTTICSTLTQEAETLKSDCKTQLLQVENLLHNKLHEVRELEYTNKTLTLDNEDLSRKIKESSKKKLQLEADIQRMHASLIKTQDEIIKMTKDLSEISLSHRASAVKLSDLEERTFKEETRMKSLSDMLRKQILDEARTIKATQAKIAAVAAEMQNREREVEKVKEELMKAVAKIEKPITALETSVKSLRNEFAQKSQEQKMMYQKWKESVEKFKEESLQLGQRKNTLEQQLSNTQTMLFQVYGQFKQTTATIENLLNETRNLKQYGLIVEKSMKSTETSISILQEDYNMLECKLNDIKYLSKNILNEFEALAQRLNEDEEGHTIQLRIRLEILKQSKVTHEAEVNENMMLAKKYQALQICHLTEKGKLLCAYEKRLKMEATLRDRLQISVLQSRMHRALVKYFKQRGLYSQAGLAKFQAASQENAQKILAVQEEMSKTIQHVSTFLTSLTDGSPSEDSIENKQSISDAETKDKKSHTVQITV